MHNLGIQGNPSWAILLSLLLVLSFQLNHYQDGDGPSCCYAILVLQFAPSY